MQSMWDVPSLCNLLNKTNHFGWYYLHDNFALCLNVAYGKDCTIGELFQRKYLYHEPCWLEHHSSNQQAESLLASCKLSRTLHRCLHCLKGRNLGMCPSSYWTGVSLDFKCFCHVWQVSGKLVTSLFPQWYWNDVFLYLAVIVTEFVLAVTAFVNWSKD